MKNQSRLGKKINQHKTSYNKEIGVLLGLTICFLVMLHGVADYGDEKYVVEVQENVKEIPTESIEDKIKQYFPRSWETMIAVAHAESGMNPNAKGYNCFYNKDKTIVYSNRVKGSHSTACKVSHRVYAYSVDCNVLQRNVKGQVCPVQTLDEHLKEVAELSKIQGFNSWSAYNNGSYKKYLSIE